MGAGADVALRQVGGDNVFLVVIITSQYHCIVIIIWCELSDYGTFNYQ